MKQEEHKRRKRRVSPLKKILIVLGIAILVFAISATPFFNVKKFTVDGGQYYSEEEILVMGNCKTGRNIFWGSNLKDIETRLLKDSYIESVKIKRKLPDIVQISVKERTQVAAVMYGNNFVVIDDSGLVLRKTEVEPQVTLVQGLTISKIEVGVPIEVEEKVKLRQTLELINTANSHDMYFTKVVMTKAGVNAYVLENLICQGSPQNIMEALKNESVQKVVASLFEKNIERGVIKISGGEYISFNPSVE
ncbi:MAG: FtsQ-type POTRA domain-containing protein [Firmicutes bacterium]|nr:FtsQ-type POTRA domain-containing protein [Bacillota bacterium]